MKLRRTSYPSLRTPAFALIAILAGATVLLGYFIRLPFLYELRHIFLNWAVILVAVALLVGILNLVSVHLKKIRTEEKNSLYSFFLLIALVVAFVVTLVFGPASPWSAWLFDHILLPVESSLIALLAVALIYAIARMFWRGVTLINLVFASVALLCLAIPALLSWLSIPWLGELNAWVNHVLALAGARAILIGVALGMIATGLRVLIGADRPYEG